jgi:hypothetical protein
LHNPDAAREAWFKFDTMVISTVLQDQKYPLIVLSVHLISTCAFTLSAPIPAELIFDVEVSI